MSSITTQRTTNANPQTPELAIRQGRSFGWIVLAAFLLYGIGSAYADQSFGIAFVLINSTAVAIAGVIGFRLLQVAQPMVGRGYLAARVAEAVLLAGGILLAQIGDVADADNTGYLLGMVALAIGSVPFCLALGRERWLPQALATWGILGYVALAAGAAVELATEQPLTVIFAIPGGLFELALGFYLVRNGFRRLD